MAKFKRKSDSYEKEQALKWGTTFSIGEIEDVVDLILAKEIPNMQFSDNEISLWSMLKDKFNIRY